MCSFQQRFVILCKCSVSYMYLIEISRDTKHVRFLMLYTLLAHVQRKMLACVSSGVAVDMSVDHKPSDLPELERIKRAGGQVGVDSRVNGGLNLSRAIGRRSKI